jgi:hypothetical protein
MLIFPAAIKVYQCTFACDMRRSFDGLSIMAQHIIRCNPFSGRLLVFCNQRSDRLKILYWDRDVVIYQESPPAIRLPATYLSETQRNVADFVVCKGVRRFVLCSASVANIAGTSLIFRYLARDILDLGKLLGPRLTGRRIRESAGA